MAQDPTDLVTRLCEEWVQESRYEKDRGIPVWAIQIGVIVALGVVFAVFICLTVFFPLS